MAARNYAPLCASVEYSEEQSKRVTKSKYFRVKSRQNGADGKEKARNPGKYLVRREASELLLRRLFPAFAVVKLLQIRSARRIPDHFFGIVGKLAHDLEQFPFTADHGVHF